MLLADGSQRCPGDAEVRYDLAQRTLANALVQFPTADTHDEKLPSLTQLDASLSGVSVLRHPFIGWLRRSAAMQAIPHC